MTMVGGRSAEPNISLAAVKDQRHHQILFVIEVTHQPPEHAIVRHGKILRCPARRLLHFALAAQERISSIDHFGHGLVDGVMILLQHFETAQQAWLGGAEAGKIVMVLHPMMGIELGQEELQPWCEPGAELIYPGDLRPYIRRTGYKHASKLAEHGMALQPEADMRAEIGMRQPDLARIALE